MSSVSRVPMIEPVSTDYYIACHYFPGWAVCPNGYSPLRDIRDFPERTPLIGYYDERDPEVFDWQVKWALEHGIRCFFYCWYRRFGSVGRMLTKDDAILGHAIEAQKQAAYGSMIDYAIMWECDNAAIGSDIRDLTDHLLPFWVEHYFSDANYAKIGNKPLIGIYDPAQHMKAALGSADAVREALAALNEKSREYGFDGLSFMVNYYGSDHAAMDDCRALGFEHQFAYCWFANNTHPSQEDILRNQFLHMKHFIDYDPAYSVLTCSAAWDPAPWRKHAPEVSYDDTAWHLTPQNFRRLLAGAREFMDALPENALGRRFILMDNWNEWCEGHYLMPHREYGFAYLEAIREVFTKRDNLPDYRLPAQLGLGPYDKAINENAERIWFSFD